MKLNQQLRNLKEEVAPDRITLRQMQRDRMMMEQFNRRRAGDTSNDNGAWAGMTSSPFQDMQLEPPSLLRPYRCIPFYNVPSIVLNYNTWIIILSSDGGLQHFYKLQHSVKSIHTVKIEGAAQTSGGGVGESSLDS